VCDKLVDLAIELHTHGPAVFRCYDPNQNAKYKAGFKRMTFAQRIDKIVELLLRSKSRVNDLMKHKGMDDVVGFPDELIKDSVRDHEHNNKRADNLTLAQAVNTATTGIDVDQIESTAQQLKSARSNTATASQPAQSTAPADCRSKLASSYCYRCWKKCTEPPTYGTLSALLGTQAL